MSRNWSRQRTLAGVGVAAAAVVLYLSTLAGFVNPVGLAQDLAGYLGLDPFSAPTRPIWSMLLKVAASLPVGDLALRCNLVGVPFAALSVWLLYTLMVMIQHNRSAEECLTAGNKRPYEILSGVVAAMVLMLCPPFWYAATRADPATLHAALLLGSVVLMMKADRSPDRTVRYAVASAFVYGVGMTEFPTMALLAPLYVLYLLYVLWRLKLLGAANLLRVGAAGALGFSLLLPLLWLYSRTPSFQWIEFSGYWHLVWMYVKGLGIVLLRGTPRVGWLIVLLFSVLPWFLVVLFARQSMTRRQQLHGSYLLNAMCFCLGFLILFNQHIAPFRLLEIRPLLVTPYLFWGSWFGYLAGYWAIIVSGRRPHHRNPPGVLRIWAGRMVIPVVVVSALVSAWTNYPAISPRQFAPLAKMAEEVVNSLDGRTWLISNGAIDASIAIAAHDRGIPLRLIDGSRVSSPTYREYLASRFESPRLQSVADIGLTAFLEEWSQSTPDWEQHVAMLSTPEIWDMLGYEALPSGALYLGTTADRSGVQASKEIERRRRQWEGIRECLAAADRPPDVIQPYVRWVRSHFGKVANDTGVVLADASELSLADEVFQEARRLDPTNVSALLNRYALILESGKPGDEGVLEEVEAFKQTKRDVDEFWAIWNRNGQIRNPAALIDQAWTWVGMGRPSQAIEAMEQAVTMGAPEDRVELALASLYYQDGREVEGEQIYRRRLEENAEDVEAWMGLTRVAIRDGDLETARSNLDHVLELGASARAVWLEKAAVEILAEEYEEAEALLGRVLEANPENQRALGLLAVLATREGQVERASALTHRLRASKSPSPVTRITLAVLAIARGDLDSARKDLSAVLEMEPGNVVALEHILNLDVMEGRMDLAERHVRTLLTVRPRNAVGNLVLGSIQHARGEPAKAEASLRVSIEERPTAEAINSLGWLVLQRGDAEEALRLSEEALAMNPEMAEAWDTKGMSLLGLGRLDEAEEAVVEAVELAGSGSVMALHLAEVYVKQGRETEAAEVLEEFRGELGDGISGELKERVEELEARLGASS